MALRGGEDHAGIGAGGERLGELGFHQLRIAGEGAVDDRVDLEVGGVRDHRRHIVQRHLAGAVGIERQLAQLVARRLAVAAQRGRQRGAGVGCDAQIGGAQFVVDKPRQVALGVGIAGDGDGGFRALADLAQRRVGAQFAGFDHDAAIDRRGLSQRLDAAREIARPRLDAKGAAAAEQRHGHRFVDQARRLGGQFVAVDPHQRERIVGIVDAARDQGIGALAHQAGVGAVEQGDRPAGVGLRQIGVDVTSAQRHHGSYPGKDGIWTQAGSSRPHTKASSS